jgi:hypothetical protein
MSRGLEGLDLPFVLACASERTVFLAANALALFYWAPFEHTVYFSSSLSQLEGVLPFGQSAVSLRPSTAVDLSTQEVVRW